MIDSSCYTAAQTHVVNSLGCRAKVFKILQSARIWVCFFSGEARDTCWGRGMFHGYVSGYVSGVCFGYVSRHQELLYLQFRGYVTGYVSGVCFEVCFAGVQPVCHS